LTGFLSLISLFFLFFSLLSHVLVTHATSGHRFWSLGLKETGVCFVFWGRGWPV
jgi:hypothetical protein